MQRASSAFEVNKYYVNPGNPVTFPWLSRLAPNYESYRFNSLRFEYSTSSPTTLGGTVCLATDYDASDATPSSKSDMMSYSGAKRAAPWDDLTISCTGLRRYKDTHYIHTSNSRVGFTPADYRSTDICSFYFATDGITTSTAMDIGELYVTYSVTLITPQMNSATNGASSKNRLKEEIKLKASEATKNADGTLSVNRLRFMHAVKQYVAGGLEQIVQQYNSALPGGWTGEQGTVEYDQLYEFALRNLDLGGKLDPMGQLLNLQYQHKLNNVQIINYASLSDVDKVIAGRLGDIYYGSRSNYLDNDGYITIGTDLLAVAKELFPEENLRFSFSVAGKNATNMPSHNYDPLTFEGLPQVINPNGGDVISAYDKAYSYRGSLLGLPSQDNSNAYIRFEVENFGGNPGARLKFKLACFLGNHPDTIDTSAHNCPVLGVNMRIRTSPLQDGSQSYIKSWPKAKLPDGSDAAINLYIWNVTYVYVTITATRIDDQGDILDSSVDAKLRIPVVNESLDITRLVSAPGFWDTLDPQPARIKDIVKDYTYTGHYYQIGDYLLDNLKKQVASKDK